MYRQVLTHLDSVSHVIGHLREISVEPCEHDVKSYVTWSVYQMFHRSCIAWLHNAVCDFA